MATYLLYEESIDVFVIKYIIQDKMGTIKDIVFRLHNKLMSERGIDKVSSFDIEIRPRNGITSERNVTLLLVIEEELGIEFYEYLAKIRECKTIEILSGLLRPLKKMRAKSRR